MDDEHRIHKGCFCFKSVIQNWLTSTGKTLKRAQADVQFCKTNCFVWREPRSVGKKSKCGSIRSQPLLAPSKCVVLSALCMSVFSPFLFLSLCFYYSDFSCIGNFFGWQPLGHGLQLPPRQAYKFYYRLHCNVITLLPLSHEWNEEDFFSFLACLNSLERCSSDNKATSDQADITSCQPGWIVKAAGESCSDTRGALTF